MEFESLISNAESSYYKLIVVVGKSGSGKTALLRRISEEFQLPLINLGLELSRRLLSLTIKTAKIKGS
jgi:ABC-type phosphate/phosphonate transport system ATPase subunit